MNKQPQHTSLSMDVQQVLRMNSGEGELSYARNSLPQRSVILKTNPFIQKSTEQLFSSNNISILKIADLGCSSGPNTFVATSMILESVHNMCKREGCLVPEIQIFLNDLPTNDFNEVLRTVPLFYKKLKEEKGDEFDACFISATPGSFYERLFPSESIHFFYSANSLHWLSQVPKELLGEESELNKGNLALGKTSPPIVFDAYLKQFQIDFTDFLKLRSKELVRGGCLLFTLLGRQTADPFADECHHNWDDLALTLRELVSEGVLEEAKLDSFNMPYYAPHLDELRNVIETEGSFSIIHIDAQYRESNFDKNKDFNPADHTALTNNIRAVSEPVLASHFGDEVIEKLFEKLGEKLAKGGPHFGLFHMVSLAKK